MVHLKVSQIVIIVSDLYYREQITAQRDQDERRRLSIYLKLIVAALFSVSSDVNCYPTASTSAAMGAVYSKDRFTANSAVIDLT